MLFVAIGNVRAGTAKERMARRLAWTYPPGLTATERRIEV